MHAVSRISKLARSKQDYNLRHRLCIWRDFVELRQYQQEALDQVITRHAKRDKRTAFVMWLGQVKAEQISKRYDNMSNLISVMNFK